MVSSKRGGYRVTLPILAALGAVSSGCIDRLVAAIPAKTQSGVTEVIRNEALDKVDLLLMVDNSGSMRDNQQNIMTQFGPLITRLTNPSDGSPPVRDLHVGVVSSDLGTPGTNIRGCSNGSGLPDGTVGGGDDGVLNPIRYGLAMADHLPWAPRMGDAAPAGFRPDRCRDQNEFPAFISFNSGGATPTDPTRFAEDFRCNAGLFVNGCGLEQQLEAIWRALVWHGKVKNDLRLDPTNGNSEPFLREEALLAIVALTDEEDGSVRDCRYALSPRDMAECTAQGNVNPLDVFKPIPPLESPWGRTMYNNNLRFYLYDPGTPTDPNWNVDRYIHPTDPTAGFLQVKPGHPERVVFAAITGVPLNVPTLPAPNPMPGDDPPTDWDQLLGTPGAMGPNDFYGRNSRTAVNMMTTEGPISMYANNPDTNCPDRMVPACRAPGVAYNTSMPQCQTTEQYYAWPARRVVEVARRFDQAALCGGQPCRNGLVTSVCSTDYSPAMSQIIRKIQSRLTGRCLPRVLTPRVNAAGNLEVECIIRELSPGTASTPCDAARGRQNPTEGSQTMTMGTTTYRVCEIKQVPLVSDSNRTPVAGQQGWYYDTSIDPNQRSCGQRISFTSMAQPQPGTQTQLECIQSITGVSTDAGTTTPTDAGTTPTDAAGGG